MRPETPFFIASIDKLMNAAIVLKLHERGVIALDATLGTYLPASRVAGLHRLKGADYSDRVTVRHLLGHTSGLANWLEDAPKGGRSLVDEILAEGDRDLSLDDILDRVRTRLTPHFAPQPLDATRPLVRYSDTNYILLAAIIEAVAGRPLHEAHAAMLRKPLSLGSTWMVGEPRPGGAGEPAALWAGTRPIEIPRLMRSFAGIYSTAADLVRFMRGLVEGRIFERRDTYALMQGEWRRFGFPRDRAALRAPQWPIEYGLGLMRFNLPRFLTPFRAVPALVGHTGSTGSWAFHCPDRDLFLAGTVDQVTAGPIPFRFVPRLLRALS